MCTTVYVCDTAFQNIKSRVSIQQQKYDRKRKREATISFHFIARAFLYYVTKNPNNNSNSSRLYKKKKNNNKLSIREFGSQFTTGNMANTCQFCSRQNVLMLETTRLCPPLYLATIYTIPNFRFVILGSQLVIYLHCRFYILQHTFEMVGQFFLQYV